MGRAPLGAMFRIFEFDNGVTGSLTGLTITEGNSGAGGGILNKSGRLTLTRVAVVANESVEELGEAPTGTGGGIHSIGPLTLRESVVSGNRAASIEGSFETAAGGGGVYALARRRSSSARSAATSSRRSATPARSSSASASTRWMGEQGARSRISVLARGSRHDRG